MLAVKEIPMKKWCHKQVSRSVNGKFMKKGEKEKKEPKVLRTQGLEQKPPKSTLNICKTHEGVKTTK